MVYLLKVRRFIQVGKWKGCLLSILLAGIIISCSSATEPVDSEPPDTEPSASYFPDENWEEITDLEAAGWSEEKLDQAEAYTDTLHTAAVVIVHKGRIGHKWGEVERKFKCHSIRKSLLSVLYGIHVANGNIDLSTTLEKLGIDDNEPPLTYTEKQATVRMLLQARSGVYHPALYETAAMAERRPERGSHSPGTYWYYNNWDFNALGTIFEQETGTSIFEEFGKAIAEPSWVNRMYLVKIIDFIIFY